MAEDNKNRSLTVGDVYEVLIPAMKEFFPTTEKFDKFYREFKGFKNDNLTSQDKILKDLEILMAEKEMGYHQK